MAIARRSTISLAALLGALGCTEPRSTPGGGLGTATFVGGAPDGADVTVDLSVCVRCHGDAARAVAAGDAPGIQLAPPVDVSRNAAGGKVGAHQAHLGAGGLRADGVPCATCHVTPAHPDQHVPGVAMRGLAATSWTGAPAIAPAYAGGICSNTYCHGAFPGGLARTVSWTGGAAEAACGTCHGRPPGPPHPTTGACGACHPGYTDTTVNPETHIDGEITGGCTACHGTDGREDGGVAGVTYDANQDAAPPIPFHAETSGVLVGAHLAHVNPTPSTAGGAQPSGGVYRPIACTECHPDNTIGGHPDFAQATVTFALATGADLAGYAPTRTLGNGSSTPTTCATYCHLGIGGGSVATWAWNGPPADCGSCHGFPPASHGSMTSSAQCAPCHDGTVRTDGTIDIAGGLHIDGIVQASGCTGCHGTEGRPNGDMTYAYDANQAAAPPVDTHGASTGVLVGAHLAHVNPSNASGVYKPIACTECHPNNTSGGHPDHARAEVTFALATAANLAGFVPGATAGDGATTPTTCTTYCHNGATGASATAWSWNGAAATCASCHGAPPATAGHAGLDATSNCGGCHPGYSATTVNLDTHINGQLDGGESIGGLACRDCHASIFTAMSTTVSPPANRHQLALDGPTDTALSWTGTLSSNLAASRSCVNMCHGDHPHDLTSPLVITHEHNVYLDASTQATRGGTTRTSATRAKTDFVLGEAKGGLCTSCHLNPISTGRPTVTVASYGATAHDFTSASGSTWRYTLHSGAFERNCTKCHASATEGTTPTATANSSGTTSVHFNANDRLLAGKYNPAGTADGFVCYNCHGSTATPADGFQGNRSGKDIQSRIALTRNHPANADAVHDSVTEFANAAFGNTLGGKARHANCMDCHDTHAAKAAPMGSYSTGTIAVPTTAVACPAGTAVAGANACATMTGSGTAFTSAHVGWKVKSTAGTQWLTVVGVTSATVATVHPAPSSAIAAGSSYQMVQAFANVGTAAASLDGSWGAKLSTNPAFWAAPAAGNFTKQAIAAGTDLEATLCFKCHSSFYGTLPPPPSWSPNTWAGTDTAREFNPANVGNFAGTWASGETAGSFHPVLASAGSNLGATSNVLPPWTRTSLMRCSDCHESSNLVDPNGPHGSSAGFLLKGPNTTWNASLRSLSSNAWMPAGTFCLNCHANLDTNGRFPDHSKGDHSIACFNCHAAIPHGGPRPGLLVAIKGVAAAVPAVIPEWDRTAPYYQGTAAVDAQENGLYLKSYPTNNTTAWAKANCGCNNAGSH